MCFGFLFRFIIVRIYRHFCLLLRLPWFFVHTGVLLWWLLVGCLDDPGDQNYWVHIATTTVFFRWFFRYLIPGLGILMDLACFLVWPYLVLWTKYLLDWLLPDFARLWFAFGLWTYTGMLLVPRYLWSLLVQLSADHEMLWW